MRYVMVWFTCSWKGCDVKAETLVPARTDGMGQCRITMDTRPDGWHVRARNRQEECDDRVDRERTYCPVHGFKDWDTYNA